MSAILGMLLAGGGAPGVVQITNSGASHIVSDPSNAIALIIVRSDGTIDKEEGGVITQLNSSTDWIIPNGAASGDFEVRFTLQDGDAPNAGNSSTGSWLALSSDRSIGYSTTSPDINSGTILVEIRYLSGGALESGEFTITARVN